MHGSTVINRLKVTKSWNQLNLLNHLKPKEIVCRRPRALHFHIPPALEEIEQLHCVKLLGVLFQDNLQMDSYVQYILSQCAQRMYLLKLLQHQGMPLNKLRVVVYSLIVSRIGYVLPAWGGFVSVELCSKIDAMFKRLKRYGYTTDYLTFSDLLEKASILQHAPELSLFTSRPSPSSHGW